MQTTSLKGETHIMADMNSRTVEGLLAFLDYLKEKHFLAPNSVEGLKTAVKKVFEGVDGANASAVQLADLDLDGYIRRFQVAEGRNYRPETIAVYGRRIKQAIEAQRHYVDTGDVPTFKTAGTKAAPGKSSGTGSAPNGKKSKSMPAAATPLSEPTAELVEFPFDAEDVTRISQFVRALSFEPQKQIPERTGEDELAA
jgi:hypothetical protein